MKKLLLVLALLPSVCAFAKDKNPAEFTIPVHVASCHSEREVTGSHVIQNTYTHDVYGSHNVTHKFQYLAVTIDSKKYDLRSERPERGVIETGDYKAKTFQKHKATGYELMFPDGKTRKYEVVGETE